jgi:hypothetical protein
VASRVETSDEPSKDEWRLVTSRVETSKEPSRDE